ncbi:hypothetical protein CCR94_23340 [Rhodoblastus sphagnicola]|uniref:Uncharacterized protein n=1 Tax=Rhodoblastus sphagnicola TaxID=333368 RepID=A0A2S6MUD6_9HYPH|nr:hypothetical protein [Rhodoblastus sphagnicola]MBB4197029.1 hypothetical protein [Rhodoblastus sphagnicola]PPQ25968.1 hypothetical protein CCR94_23340 [Rhodoblastus sphagnicola]
MADSTTFDGGGDVPLFVAETPPRRVSNERANIDALREKVRELGLDLKRNWSEASERSVEAPSPVAEPPAQQPARTEPARKEWLDRLSDEYREDFLAQPPANPTAAVSEGEERHPLANRAYALGRLAFALESAIKPPVAALFGFASAYGGLVLKTLLGVLLLLAAQGLLRDWPKPVQPAPPSVAPIAWIEIAKPYPLFDLSAPILGRAQPLYSARRHVAGGGREDVMTFGQFAGPKPFLRVGVYRHGTEDASDPGYFVDMARRASATGLGVTEADLPQALQTRFGDFESGALQLSGAAGVKRGNCRGFRVEVAAPALTMGGLMCGGGDEKVSATDLACVIDRLDLLAAGQDRALSDFFGAAGTRKSRACAEATRRK